MDRRVVSLDAGWRFHLGEPAVPPKKTHLDFYLYDASQTGGFRRGPEGPDYDDSAWRQVAVPHDWMVEEDFSAEGGVSRGYRRYGTAWYRLGFDIPADADGQRLLLVFDGMSVANWTLPSSKTNPTSAL